MENQRHSMAIRWPFTAHPIRSAPHTHQVDEGHGTDESADEIFEYAKDGDIFNGSTDKGQARLHRKRCGAILVG